MAKGFKMPFLFFKMSWWLFLFSPSIGESVLKRPDIKSSPSDLAPNTQSSFTFRPNQKYIKTAHDIASLYFHAKKLRFQTKKTRRVLKKLRKSKENPLTQYDAFLASLIKLGRYKSLSRKSLTRTKGQKWFGVFKRHCSKKTLLQTKTAKGQSFHKGPKDNEKEQITAKLLRPICLKIAQDLILKMAQKKKATTSFFLSLPLS